jgi:tetratricopeptide (TPR) repeat protein
MDESKQAGAAAGAGSGSDGGAVSAGLRPSGGPRRAKFKLAGLLVGTVVLLAALSFGGYKLLHKAPANQVTVTNTSSASTPKLNSQEQVTAYLDQKNYAAAAAIYTNQLKTATTADAKAQANMGLCGVYTAKQDYATAYQYALKAYGDETTVQTAETAAGAAKNAGNTADAVKYYQAAINLVPKENVSSDVRDYTLRVLQAHLQEVSQ